MINIAVKLSAIALTIILTTFPCNSVLGADGITLTSPAETCDQAIWKGRAIGARPRIGLALGGGGARGAATIGALRVLDEAGIKVDLIAGTSIGAVVGGLYAAGVSVDEIERLFRSGKLMQSFMTVSLATRILLAPVLYLPRLFGNKAYDGLYRGNKFRKFLERDIPSGKMNIEDLRIPFAAISLNLLDGKLYMIRKGKLGFAMQASSAVPGLRKPVEIEDKLFVDGGVACNLPVKQCREMGADFVIAINIDEPFGELPKDHFRRPGSVADWLLTWDLYTIDQMQSDLADVVIHPDTKGIHLLSTKRDDARRGVVAGEQAARAVLPLIKRKLEELDMKKLTAR